MTPYDYPYDVVVDRLAALGRRVPADGSGRTVLCVGHGENRPSLSVAESADGHVLLHCHAGCSLESVLHALALKKSQLFLSEFTSRFGHRRAGHARRVLAPADRHTDTTDDADPEVARAIARISIRLRYGPEDLAPLARALRLPDDALRDFGVGYDPESGRYAFVERDGAGTAVGLLFRELDGTKRALPGGCRGLTIPGGNRPPAPLYLAEGPTDAIALHAAGLYAVGRPSALTPERVYGWIRRHLGPGAAYDVVVVGDNEPHHTGRGQVGREAARALAERLAADGVTTGAVSWARPTGAYKDIREMCADGGWRNVRLHVTEVRARKGVPA